jgi:hypothetical protein
LHVTVWVPGVGLRNVVVGPVGGRTDPADAAHVIEEFGGAFFTLQVHVEGSLVSTVDGEQATDASIRQASALRLTATVCPFATLTVCVPQGREPPMSKEKLRR